MSTVKKKKKSKDERLRERGFRFIDCVIKISVWNEFIKICGDDKPSDVVSDLIVEAVEKQKKQGVL